MPSNATENNNKLKLNSNINNNNENATLRTTTTTETTQQTIATCLKFRSVSQTSTTLTATLGFSSTAFTPRPFHPPHNLETKPSRSRQPFPERSAPSSTACNRAPTGVAKQPDAPELQTTTSELHNRVWLLRCSSFCQGQTLLLLSKNTKVKYVGYQRLQR